MESDRGCGGTVFLFDVDNTLLDNDRVIADMRRYLAENFDARVGRRYWEIFETLRSELGYADYLGALQRYRREDLHDPKLLELSCFLIDYPFSNRIFPESLDVIDRVRQWGRAAILSDGDVVFQPRKVQRSGLWDAFGGHVLIFIHKEADLDDVERLYPAEHYVMFDDKLRILAAMKTVWGSRVTTVFVRQGHYALEPGVESKYPPADLTVGRIGDVLAFDPATLGVRAPAA